MRIPLEPPKQRTRSKGFTGNPVTTSVHEVGNGCSNTSEINLGTFTVMTTGSETTMTDLIDRNFKRRLRAGDIMMHPMTRTRRESLLLSQGGCSIKSNSTSCSSPVLYHMPRISTNAFSHAVCSGKLAPVRQVIPDAQVEQMINLVSTKTWAGRGKSTSSNLFETLAEIRKTSDLWSRLGERFTSVIARPVKTQADEFLRYKFGLRPLLQDLEFVLDRTIDPLKRLRNRQFTRAKDEIVLTDTQNYSGAIVGLAGRLMGYASYQSSSTEVLTVRGVSVDDFQWNGFDIDYLGLSPKSLLTLPWELTGNSFVIDYFINVGDFLNAIAPALGYEYKGSCLTVSRICVTTTSCTGFTPVGGYSTTLAPIGSVQGELDVKYRTALRAPSIQRQFYPWTTKDGSFNFDRAATLFELCAQRLAKRRP